MRNKIILGITLVILAIIGIYVSKISTTNKDSVQSSQEIDFSQATTSDITLENKTVKITKGGVYTIQGTIEDGSIIVDTEDNVQLILTDVTITNSNGPAIYIENAKNTVIELNGTNTLTATTTTDLDAAIYSKDDLFITGSGTLIVNSNIDGIASSDDLVIEGGTYQITASDDGIKGKDSVTITDGTFTIDATGDGIKTTNETEKGDLKISGGTFVIHSKQDGISSAANLTIEGGTFEIETNAKDSSTSSKGLKADKEVMIYNGTFTIHSTDDAIHSNTNVTIYNGQITIQSGDDGIHADGTVTIKDGTIDIQKSYEGIEGYNITIDGGDINVVASDDGINIGNTNTTNNNRNGMDADNGGKLTINNGTIYVNASGDGLDSNGSIYMNGGTVYVDGPTNNGNGALDYNGKFIITGGELIAVGSSGMAQNVSSSSTQTSVLINLSTTTSGKITLGDITYTPSKSYQSIVISSASLKSGEQYTLTTGSTTQSIQLTNTVTSIGSMGQGFGGMQGMPNDMQGQGMPGDMQGNMSKGRGNARR